LKKKWAIVLGVAFLVVALTTIAFAGNPIKLIVNGKEIKPDVLPQLINGRTMVPVRWVAEALGANVWWDESKRIVRIDFGKLPQRVQKKWQYPFPRGGELSFGYLGKRTSFVLPAVTTLNAYLAERQDASLEPVTTSQTQKVLVRYEILDTGATYNPLMATETNTEHMAYELVVRLYYSEFPVKEDSPPSIIRLFHQKAEDGLHASFKQLTPLRNWYEDVVFIVRPMGNVAEVVKDEAAGRTTWVQGREGWYVDEKATHVLRKAELKEMPILFDYPLPPDGYGYTLIKEQ